jgi:inorganic triphosphatase YgiF
VPFERLRNIQNKMSQLSNDLKRCMDECKDIYTKQVDRLQRERDTALLAASQIEDPNNINAQLPPGVEISNKKVSSTRHDKFAQFV